MLGRTIKRSDRVAERVRQEVMDMILRGALRDPAARGVFINHVAVSDDIRHARLYIRLTDARADQATREAAVAALNRASGFIRRNLSPRLQLKYLPELRFFWDETVDSAARIEEVLSELGEGQEEGT